MLTFIFEGKCGKMEVPEKLTSGTYGKQVLLKFSSEWDDLQKTAVFMALEGSMSTTCSADVSQEIIEIPAAVLANPEHTLYVQVQGFSPDGTEIINTGRVRGPRILPGIDAGELPKMDVENPVWYQVLSQMGDLGMLETSNNHSLVSAINELALREPETGASAYEIAKANGYKGSEAQWLESLAGKNAYEYALDAGFIGSEEEFAAELIGNNDICIVGLAADDNDNYTADKTYYEIAHAHALNKLVFLRYGIYITHILAGEYTENSFLFEPLLHSVQGMPGYVVDIYNNWSTAPVTATGTGSEAENVIFTVTLDETCDGEYRASATYMEIAQARAVEKLVLLRYGVYITHILAGEPTESSFLFEPLLHSVEGMPGYIVDTTDNWSAMPVTRDEILASDITTAIDENSTNEEIPSAKAVYEAVKAVREEVKDNSTALTVTVTGDTASHTALQIRDHVKAGGTAVLEYGGSVYNFISYYSNEEEAVFFTTSLDDSIKMVTVSKTGKVESSSVDQTGSNAMVVTVTDGTASHTALEIAAHVQSGGAVVLEYAGAVCNLLSIDNDDAEAKFSYLQWDNTLREYTVDRTGKISSHTVYDPSAHVMTVTVTEGAASHTASEIADHVESGGTAVLEYSGTFCNFISYDSGEDEAKFSYLGWDNTIKEYTVNSTGQVSISIVYDSSAHAMVVTVEDGTASHTALQIRDHVKAGGTAVLEFYNDVYSFLSYDSDEDEAKFSYLQWDNTIKEYTVDRNGKVSTSTVYVPVEHVATIDQNSHEGQIPTAKSVYDLITENMSVGIHTDGLMYLFVDGQPVGSGVALPSGEIGDVYGYVDSENNIVVTGNLADGTYSVKYEMADGSTIDIGDLVLTESEPDEPTEPSYTNILTSGDYAIELNKRWSGSAKSFTDCNGMIGFIVPAADVLDKTIRFKGFTKNLKSSGQSPLWMSLDSSKAKIGVLNGSETNGHIWNADSLVDDGGGVYSIAINSSNFSSVSSVAYFVLNMAVNTSASVISLDGLIMTIDEEIA